MSDKKRKWTEDEEAALRSGVAKYGDSKDTWVRILVDKLYSETLQGRSNTNLKDKWRNIYRKALRSGDVTVASSMFSVAKTWTCTESEMTSEANSANASSAKRPALEAPAAVAPEKSRPKPARARRLRLVTSKYSTPV
jgi:myb proto-oncogene protein